MAKVAIFLLFLLCIFFISGMAKPASSRQDYIEELCKETPSPDLCVQYLSIFPNSTIQNPLKMAKAAFLASLYRAQYTKLYTLKEASKSKLIEDPVVEDCLDQVSSTVDDIIRSITELGFLGSHEKDGGDGYNRFCDDYCHVGNIATWMSAAVTSSYSCVDELDELVKSNKSILLVKIKTRFHNVLDAVGNALTLFCMFAAKCE